MKTTFLVLVLAAVAVKHAASHCRPVKDNVKLSAMVKGPCEIKQKKNATLFLMSPGFPNPYTGTKTCKFILQTEVAPRHLRVFPKEVKLSPKDKLFLKTPFQRKYNITNSSKGKTLYSSSSYSRINFKPKAKGENKAFKIKIRAKGNKCHQVCNLHNRDSKGVLEQSSYGAGSFCQWWFTAPEGCKVELNFVSFDVGAAADSSGKCPGDYMGVDTKGNRRYKGGSSQHCGSSPPSTIMSRDNKMNVIFNGQDGGGKGFTINYAVRCPATTPGPTTTGPTSPGPTTLAPTTLGPTTPTNQPTTTDAPTTANALADIGLEVAQPVSCNSQCPSSFTLVSDVGCVMASTEAETWETAIQRCAARGGKLFVPASHEQLVKLNKHLAATDDDIYYWIGGRQASSGSWKYSNGASVPSPSWDSEWDCPDDDEEMKCINAYTGSSSSPLCNEECDYPQEYVCHVKVAGC